VGLRATGGVLSACEAVCAGTCTSAYALVRPPGHHARADFGMGFCIFNNIVVAARHLQRTTPYKRIAIVDYDVHHGNGTQEAFYDDSSVLFVSIHQESNYPHGSGPYTDTGAGGSGAEGTTINIPLPPGSGHGAYMAALHTVILPALDAFAPDFVLVSSGFDASFQDPLASMMLSSETFGAYARALQAAANRLCHGRLVCAHEGVSVVYLCLSLTAHPSTADRTSAGSQTAHTVCHMSRPGPAVPFTKHAPPLTALSLAHTTTPLRHCTNVQRIHSRPLHHPALRCIARTGLLEGLRAVLRAGCDGPVGVHDVSAQGGGCLWRR